MKALSNLAQSVRASTTLAIDTQFNKMRSEGIDVIGFSVGQPDFPTPEHIKQAGIRAIQENLTKYTPTPGTPAVRKAVADRLDADWGLDYTPEEIVVSGGGKPILYVALKTLIDPGDDAARVEKLVEQSGCALRYILLTHGHFDHTSAVRPLLERYPDVPVYIHEKDSVTGRGGELLFTRVDEQHQRYYKEGDMLPLGGLSLRVMETPGHSEGSVCLLLDREHVIFAGDTLFRCSCGRCDFPGGSYPKMLVSLGRLAALESDWRVLPGHDRETTLDFERRMNPYMRQGTAQ